MFLENLIHEGKANYAVGLHSLDILIQYDGILKNRTGINPAVRNTSDVLRIINSWELLTGLNTDHYRVHVKTQVVSGIGKYTPKEIPETLPLIGVSEKYLTVVNENGKPYRIPLFEYGSNGLSGLQRIIFTQVSFRDGLNTILNEFIHPKRKLQSAKIYDYFEVT